MKPNAKDWQPKENDFRRKEMTSRPKSKKYRAEMNNFGRNNLEEVPSQ